MEQGKFQSFINPDSDYNLLQFQRVPPGIARNDSHISFLSSSISENNDNVKVCIRVRPLNERETVSGVKFGKCLTIESDNNSIQVDSSVISKQYNFDFIADENVGQEVLFDKLAKPIIESCIQGINGSIFAYGQTGAGKTYTIQGLPYQKGDDEYNLEHRGILQRSFELMFEKIREIKQQNPLEKEEFSIKCTFFEIYNEQIKDLMISDTANQHSLLIREDAKKGVYIQGITQIDVINCHDVIEIIKLGTKNRHTGATKMNEQSSRSHSVLTTFIESKVVKNGFFGSKHSTFHIIDLAGSEKTKQTQAEGQRLKEASMINKSLSALGNVIKSLAGKKAGDTSGYVPYRDSRLTFILKNSLGGNSKTLIIANVSPSKLNYLETISTLEFAKRAKMMKNEAVVNDSIQGSVESLQNEIQTLKAQLFSLRQQNLFLKQSKYQKELKSIEINMDQQSIIQQSQSITQNINNYNITPPRSQQYQMEDNKSKQTFEYSNTKDLDEDSPFDQEAPNLDIPKISVNKFGIPSIDLGKLPEPKNSKTILQTSQLTQRDSMEQLNTTLQDLKGRKSTVHIASKTFDFDESGDDDQSPLQLELDEIQEELLSSRHINIQQEEKYKKLLKAFHRLEEKFQEAQLQIKCLKEENTNLICHQSDLSQKISSLEISASDKQNEYFQYEVQLQKQNEKIIEELDSYKEQCFLLKQQLKSETSYFREITERDTTTQLDTINELKSQLIEAKNQNAQLSYKYESLLVNSNQKINSQESEIKELSEQNQQFALQIDLNNQQTETFRQEVEHMHQFYHNAEQDLVFQNQCSYDQIQLQRERETGLIQEKEELKRLLAEAEQKIDNFLIQQQSPMSNLARSIRNMDCDSQQNHLIESLHNSLKFKSECKNNQISEHDLSDMAIDQLNDGFLDRLSEQDIQLRGSIMDEQPEIYIEEIKFDEQDNIYCSPKHSRNQSKSKRSLTSTYKPFEVAEHVNKGLTTENALSMEISSVSKQTCDQKNFGSVQSFKSGIVCQRRVMHMQIKQKPINRETIGSYNLVSLDGLDEFSPENPLLASKDTLQEMESEILGNNAIPMLLEQIKKTNSFQVEKQEQESSFNLNPEFIKESYPEIKINLEKILQLFESQLKKSQSPIKAPKNKKTMLSLENVYEQEIKEKLRQPFCVVNRIAEVSIRNLKALQELQSELTTMIEIKQKLKKLRSVLVQTNAKSKLQDQKSVLNLEIRSSPKMMVQFFTQTEPTNQDSVKTQTDRQQSKTNGCQTSSKSMSQDSSCQTIQPKSLSVVTQTKTEAKKQKSENSQTDFQEPLKSSKEVKTQGCETMTLEFSSFQCQTESYQCESFYSQTDTQDFKTHESQTEVISLYSLGCQTAPSDNETIACQTFNESTQKASQVIIEQGEQSCQTFIEEQPKPIFQFKKLEVKEYQEEWKMPPKLLFINANSKSQDKINQKISKNQLTQEQVQLDCFVEQNLKIKPATKDFNIMCLLDECSECSKNLAYINQLQETTHKKTGMIKSQMILQSQKMNELRKQKSMIQHEIDISTKRYQQLIKTTNVAQVEFERVQKENKQLREDRLEAVQQLTQCQILLLSKIKGSPNNDKLSLSKIFKVNSSFGLSLQEKETPICNCRKSKSQINLRKEEDDMVSSMAEYQRIDFRF